MMRVLMVLAAAAAMPATSAAQDSTSNEYLSPEQTRVCICMEDELQSMQGEMDEAKQAREQVAEEFARLDALVEQARATIDVNDQAETDSFRRMFYRREELRQELNRVSQPYDRAAGRYNRIAQTYNAQCANRTMFKVNVDAARANPQCEATP